MNTLQSIWVCSGEYNQFALYLRPQTPFRHKILKKPRPQKHKVSKPLYTLICLYHQHTHPYDQIILMFSGQELWLAACKKKKKTWYLSFLSIVHENSKKTKLHYSI